MVETQTPDPCWINGSRIRGSAPGVETAKTCSTSSSGLRNFAPFNAMLLQVQKRGLN